MKEVLIHEGIKTIGPKAFLQCFGLRRFIFPTISTRLATITSAGRSRVEHKIDEVSLLERRGSEVSIYAEALIRSGMLGADNIGQSRGNFKWDQVKERLDNIVRLIVCHEIKDATTLFELALWKCKLDQEDENNLIDRKACRIDVLLHILQYLCSKEELCHLKIPLENTIVSRGKRTKGRRKKGMRVGTGHRGKEEGIE